MTPVVVPPPPAPAPAQPAAEAAQPEWVALLTSIKQDIQQLKERTDTAPADETPAAEAVDKKKRRPEPARTEKAKPAATGAKKKKKPAPVQAEWGFFDPAQCGFAALLEKLDEITDDDGVDEKR
jgi:hypothetical protein